MKTLLLLILSISLFGCATSSKQPVKTIDEDTLVIELPPAPKDSINRSPFFNTQKKVINNSNGFTYEFYYGSGGRYIVVVKPPQGVFLDFANAEGTLTVAAKENNPEILSLSVDRKGIFMGSGDPRNGNVDFSLQIFVPSSRYNGSLNEKLTFNMAIADHY